MTNFDLRIDIRLATLALGRDPYSIKFPKTKAGLKSMLADLQPMTYAIARRIAKNAEAHQISPHTWTPEIIARAKAAFFQLYMADDKEDCRLARILNIEINRAIAGQGRTANLGHIIGERA